MDLKRHEGTILPVTSITMAGIIVFILKDFYIEYCSFDYCMDNRDIDFRKDKTFSKEEIII